MAAMFLWRGTSICLFTIILCLICSNYASSRSVHHFKDKGIFKEIVSAVNSGNWTTVYNTLPSTILRRIFRDCVDLNLQGGAVHDPLVVKTLNSKLKLCKKKYSKLISNASVSSLKSSNSNKLVRRLQRRQTFIIHTPPFISVEDGDTMIQDGFPLLTRTLSANRLIFNPSGSVNDNFKSTLQDVYNYIAGNWKPVNDKICKDFKAYGDTFCTATTTMNEFFQKVIRTYNDDSLFGVDKALTRQGIIYGYSPTSEEMTVGAYALTLDAILMYWGSLETITYTTYSGVNIEESEDMAKYQIGTTFTWLTFTSASITESETFKLKNTLFVIDNSQESLWQPKDVRGIQNIRGDIDVMYPVGTQFRITDRTTSPLQTRIYLKLINKVDGQHKTNVLSVIVSLCLCFVIIH